MNKITISLGMSSNLILSDINKYISPFDFTYTNYAGLIKCFNDSFLYFCDNNYLDIYVYNNKKYIYNKRYNFIIFEEIYIEDFELISNNFEENDEKNIFDEFIKKYTIIINNLLNILTDSKLKIIFLLQRYNTFQSDLYELKNIFNLKFLKMNYYIQILFIDDNLSRKILKMLDFKDNDNELERLKFFI